MRKIERIYFGIFVLLILVSCSNKTSAIFNDTFCQAPCWRNINFGQPKEEVIRRLADMEDISQDTITVGPSRGYADEAVYWYFKDRQEAEGDIFFHDQKVAMIYFEMGETIPLSEVVKKFGEPKEVFIHKITGEGKTILVHLKLIYPDKGFCLGYDPAPFIISPHAYNITSSMPVEEIYFMEPFPSESQAQIGCWVGLDEKTRGYFQEWKGYGEYDVAEILR